MMKLKQLENINYFEVIDGKRMYSNYVEKVGYSNTNTFCDMPIHKSEIKYHRVFINGTAIFLDFNDRKDLIVISPNCGVDLMAACNNEQDLKRVKEYLEKYLELVFSRYL